METEGKGSYLFGFEESYGCLIGTHARDKDAIVAVMALCEAAAYYRTKNMTLWDAMLDLYERCGFVQLGTIPGGFRMKDGHYENICPYYHTLQEFSEE